MGVLLVGEAENADERISLAREHLSMEHPERPIAPVMAVGHASCNHARVGTGRRSEPGNGRKIALEIAAGEP